MRIAGHSLRISPKIINAKHRPRSQVDIRCGKHTAKHGTKTILNLASPQMSCLWRSSYVKDCSQRSATWKRALKGAQKSYKEVALVLRQQRKSPDILSQEQLDRLVNTPE